MRNGGRVILTHLVKVVLVEAYQSCMECWEYTYNEFVFVLWVSQVHHI